MKKILFAVLMILASVGCINRADYQRSLSDLIYLHDPETKVCFAIGYVGGTVATAVPCTDEVLAKVKRQEDAARAEINATATAKQ